jgi:hypothetical protein
VTSHHVESPLGELGSRAGDQVALRSSRYSTIPIRTHCFEKVTCGSQMIFVRRPIWQIFLREPRLNVKKKGDRRLMVFLVVLALFLMAPPKAFAYLDPGTGSMFLQLWLGGIAGVVMVAKLYWRQLVRLVREQKPRQKTTPPSEDSE